MAVDRFSQNQHNHRVHGGTNLRGRRGGGEIRGVEQLSAQDPMEESSGSQSSSRQSRQKSKRASRLSITASSWLRATSRGSMLIADLCDPPFYLRLCPLLTCPLKANYKFRGRFTFFPHNFFANLLSSRLSVRISRSFRVIFFSLLFSSLFFFFFPKIGYRIYSPEG